MKKYPSIFISYATPDRERVLGVYNFLTANGYKDVWIDCEKILAGQNWDFEIKRNLQKADIVIVFFSLNSVERRGYVQREINLVINNLEEKLIDDIYIIPVKLDKNAEVPAVLSKLQWLDINSENSLHKLKISLDKQVEKLGIESPINLNTLSDVQVVKSIVSESWEGLPGYEVEYMIPNFYSDVYKNINEITKIIEARLITALHSHRIFKFEQMPAAYSWTQNKYRRTSTFDASYGNIYQTDGLISLHYIIDWYGAGAAHPNYHFKTYNFFLEPLIEIKSLEYLFEENVFEELVISVRNELTKEMLKQLNENSEHPIKKLESHYVKTIKKGTKSWSDLSSFTFSDTGITIYFSPYQVASYAMGSYTINIAYEDLPKKIKRMFTDILLIPRINYE